jgi:hypothetical protein
LDAPDPTSVQRGFTLPEIQRLLDVDCFHGWLSSSEATALLLDHPEGTFLTRFSGAAGQLALSVRHRVEVFHWRIMLQGSSSAVIYLDLDGQYFRSMEDLILFFSSSPLNIFKQQQQGIVGQLLLQLPLRRGSSLGSTDLAPPPLVTKNRSFEQ